MTVQYLEKHHVIEMHEYLIEVIGGVNGVHDSKLEAKLALPMSGFGNFDRYPSIYEKAAAYLYELASGHCFIDGNKRTSYLSAFTFLDWNGYDLIADDDEVYRIVMLVADDETRPDFET